MDSGSSMLFLSYLSSVIRRGMVDQSLSRLLRFYTDINVEVPHDAIDNFFALDHTEISCNNRRIAMMEVMYDDIAQQMETLEHAGINDV
jgi:hypothetical protein